MENAGKDNSNAAGPLYAQLCGTGTRTTQRLACGVCEKELPLALPKTEAIKCQSCGKLNFLPKSEPTRLPLTNSGQHGAQSPGNSQAALRDGADDASEPHLNGFGIAILQFVLVAIGVVLCIWVESLLDGECIGGMSVGDICVIDTVLCSIGATLGGTAICTALLMFRMYFD